MGPLPPWIYQVLKGPQLPPHPHPGLPKLWAAFVYLFKRQVGLTTLPPADHPKSCLSSSLWDRNLKEPGPGPYLASVNAKQPRNLKGFLSHSLEKMPSINFAASGHARKASGSRPAAHLYYFSFKQALETKPISPIGHSLCQSVYRER